MPQATRIRRGLLRWLSISDLPVFVLDAERVVRFFNMGCERLTGWTAADVIGRSCEYATCSDPASVDSTTTRLCPPGQVLAGTPASIVTGILHRDGSVRPRTVHYFPLPANSDDSLYILGVCTEIAANTPSVQPSGSVELHGQLVALQDRLHRQNSDVSLIGVSPSIRRVREQLKLCRSGDVTVHLSGPPGSGKEHVARLIHQRGDRAHHAFVPVDCRILPAFELKRTLRRLLEEDGILPDHAFQPGTLYIKYVGDLPRDLQDMLVAAFTKEAPQPRPYRLLTSDERPLPGLLRSERLTPEFFYLISELTLELPALAERREDVPLLAQWFLEQLNAGNSRQVDGLSPEACECIRQYNWPGNVGELYAVLQDARERASSHVIGPADLPFRFRTGMDAQRTGPPATPEPVLLEKLLTQVETDYILWALAQTKDNKTAAAALLGLTRPRLYRRMEALGLVEPGTQPPAANQPNAAGE